VKTYEAIYNPEQTKGVFGISLVDSPAMEGHFLAFSKSQKVELKTVNTEQRLLLGLVMQPNKPIYRDQDGEKFNIVFSSETVKQLSHNFFKAGYQSNSTIEHASPIEGVTFVESWIIENPDNDKAANFGLSYPKGSWIVMMKVDSDDVWERYVKQGKVKGFSIDAMVELKEIKTKSKTDVNMSKENKKSVFAEFFAGLANALKDADVKLAEVKTEDGENTLMFDGEQPEVDGAIWAMTENDERVELPVGKYAIEGGKTITVATDGIIASIEDTAAPEEEAAPAEAENVGLSAEDMKAIKDMLVSFKADADKEVKAIKAELSDSKKALTVLETKLSKYEDEPAAPKVGKQPAQVGFKKQTFTQYLNENLNS